MNSYDMRLLKHEKAFKITDTSDTRFPLYFVCSIKLKALPHNIEKHKS